MGFFDDLFGKGKSAAQARKAELRGDLPRAIELWAAAGKPDEAARVMVTRGEAEPDPRQRLVHFTQAVKLAPEGTDANRAARVRRAELVTTLAGDAAVSAVARRDILEAARDLEAIGEFAKAAQAFKLAGDTEGEARCLAAAGEVDELEHLLATEQFKDRMDRKRSDTEAEVEVLARSGRRREALEQLDLLIAANPGDLGLKERASAIRSRRATGPGLPISYRGQRVAMALGDEVTIGRTEGTILAQKSAISRQHLRIYRKDGAVWVRDLESRNGTQLRGIKLAGPLCVHEELELKLGKEVPLRLSPSAILPGAIDIDLAGTRHVAPLGPAVLPDVGWTLAAGHDGWIELAASVERPAFVGDLALVPRATLLVGDLLSAARGGDPVVRVLGD